MSVRITNLLQDSFGYNTAQFWTQNGHFELIFLYIAIHFSLIYDRNTGWITKTGMCIKNYKEVVGKMDVHEEKYEPLHEKTNNLHMRKQRRRSA